MRRRNSNYDSKSSSSSGDKTESCDSSGEKIVSELLINILFSATSYFMLKLFINYMSGESSKCSTDDRLDKIVKNQKRFNDDNENEVILLDAYERTVSQDVIDPGDINVCFKDVGGIDEIKFELQDLIVLPLLRPELFRSKSGLVSPPRGILLYGSPGTGKTMLAKAVAKEGRATFINVRLSSIMDKFYGESNKLVKAIFSLATKLAPSVIFIDELDTFLNQRDSNDNNGTAAIKSEFLTLWDGITTKETEGRPIIVIGATNRPYDVDAAILRRLPRSFEVPLPSESNRIKILELILRNHEMTKAAHDFIPRIAHVTDGYSGSDLKELCRAAAIEPIRELTYCNRDKLFNEDSKEQITNNNIRELNVQDFQIALQKVKKTGEAANSFQRKEAQTSTNARGVYSNLQTVAEGMRILSQLASLPVHDTNNLNREPSECSKEEDNEEIPHISD